MYIKNIFKKIVPRFLIIFRRKLIAAISEQFKKVQIAKIQRSQALILESIKKKEKINIIFLVIHDSIWKYDEVYRLLNNDSKFNVKIIVIPLVRNGEGQMDTYYQTLNYFQNKNYHTIESFDKDNNCWLDIKSITSPHVVFFTNPHKLTFDKYYIHNFTDRLTCYVPYTFDITANYEGQYNQSFHNLLWKFFLETKYHKNFAKEFSRIKDRNVFVSGFIGMDKILKRNFKTKKVWKNYNNDSAKKIIWAPHHTIPGQGSGLDYSCFMNYSELFKQLVQNRSDIQIAFKPHPLLKEKLYKDSGWGIARTNNYYKFWKDVPNGQLEDSDYLDLFYESDGIILDSASFTVEYLYCNKPSLFTLRDDELNKRINIFGEKVLEIVSKAKTAEDIHEFINNEILKAEDNKKEIRKEFVKKVLTFNNSKLSSEIIYNDIKNEFVKK